MFLRKYFEIYYWPPLTFGWFTTTFVITYIVSVLDGHVYAYLPNISDTGAIPPESCIFSLLVNIGAVMCGITIYIRYRQIDTFFNLYDVAIGSKWNSLALYSGLCVPIGMSIVANFQETVILPVHGLGSGLTFGIGTMYLFIQTVISFAFRRVYYKYPEYGIGPKILYFRAFLAVSCLILINVASITFILALMEFKGEKISWWTEEDGAFQLRLACSYSEWMLFIFFETYLLTMTSEYKLMEYDEVRFNSKFPYSKDIMESSKV